MSNIDNSEDIIDSRDLIERIEELEDERDSFEPMAIDDGDTVTSETWAEANPEEAEELGILKAFAAGLENYGDFEHGEALIRESYFTEYCEEMLKDIGDLPQDLPGYIVIDWEATANNLRVDYTESDFAGETYLMRV